MTDTVRIFVGSDIWQQRAGAEGALLASIHDNTTGFVETTMMRGVPWAERAEHDVPDDYRWYVNNGVQEGAWNIGCDPGDVYPAASNRTGGGWATTFTNFRWAIPEVCGFSGHAIYQDSDQLDIGDMRELLELGKASPKPVFLSQGKACVMVLDCGAFGKMKDWPSIAEMRLGKVTMYQLRAQLTKAGMIDSSMDRAWNFPDKYIKGQTKVVHHTNARTQPSRAYAHKFGKREHPNKPAVAIWHHYHNRAKVLGLV